MPISPPVQITVPFATSGLKNAIPATTNNVTGNAGYDAGFGAINMTPKTAGGIPPFGQDFNGIFYDVTLALQFLEAGGSFPYNSIFSTAIGGYPIGAVVSRTDSTGLWRNTAANNTTNPETFGAGWQPEDAGSSLITMTNANVTLTALQAARSTIVITGVLTSNLNLIFPAYTKQWLVVNSATGAFTVTTKTAAGSGVVVGTGSSQIIYGDGASINASSGNSSVPWLVGPATSPQHAAQLSQVQGMRGMSAFTANGSFTVPANVTRIFYKAVGGGGGGGASTSANSSAGGAGSGALAEGTLAVTPGQVIAMTIGAGGFQGTTGAGAAGGTTSIGGFVSCPGGSASGGIAATGIGQQGIGAATSSGATVNSPGAPGSPGVFGGGTAFFGGNGAASVFGGGLPGNSGYPGAGFGAYGCGRSGGANNNFGGSGTAGIVIITW